MAVTSDKAAPYAPASAVIEIMGRFRSRGLPVPINSDVLARAGVSGSLIPRTLYALQVLDLIDENGAPTSIFEGLRLAPESEYQAKQADWLKNAYADVFAFVDPTSDSETSVRDAFRSYQPIGQQNRMVSLFQGLCSAAGLMAGKAPSSSRPQARNGASSPNTQQSRSSTPIKHLKDFVDQPKPPTTLHGTLPPALTGLLESLPRNGASWSRTTRNKFVTTFEAVLDFCIPINEATEKGGQE